MANNDILLTHSEVQRRAARRSEVIEKVNELQAELAELDEWFAAVKVLAPDIAQNALPPQRVRIRERLRSVDPAAIASDDKPAVTITDKVLAAVATFPQGGMPAQIKEQLRSTGFNMSKFDANINYFYTVLNRLAKTGRAKKLGSGKYIAVIKD